MANSRPDLVPLNESFGSDKKKNDYISPKIKSLLETLGTFFLADPRSLRQVNVAEKKIKGLRELVICFPEFSLFGLF